MNAQAQTDRTILQCLANDYEMRSDIHLSGSMSARTAQSRRRLERKARVAKSTAAALRKALEPTPWWRFGS